ncbi:glycosyl transferase family 2 [Ktedonobacter racemifer DSM 44963]|uniref:Glycosyl transferase family 2 n=1 Tax=Ktedonobacter racemifer DSM 44963 TaxID=485913 RepID=D6U1I6_KTERA|nr:glycosyl transferase family 2 [Ktedonobacter racemifer DSM 44963]
MGKGYPFQLITSVQLFFAVRVVWRMAKGGGGKRLQARETAQATGEQVAVIVPVLNEYTRLAPCLEGLMVQGSEVCEILVVDGGSTDGTQQLVTAYAQRDTRIRLIDASPIPEDWNGKVWGLQTGWKAVVPTTNNWVLIIDADARTKPLLASTLLEHARSAQLDGLSVATQQELGSIGEGLVHPALLTTLVYRFGAPGREFQRVQDVQANGQCFLFRRTALARYDGFASTRFSVSEDVTMARMLVRDGYRVGFYEADDLVSVKMYENWREAWQNWTRSLPLHDHFSGTQTALGWLEILLVQALPLPLLLCLLFLRTRDWRILTANGVLVAMRLGVLVGTARAYPRRPWSYWFSPLCDLLVAMQLGRMALRRKHTWRGRTVIRRGSL